MRNLLGRALILTLFTSGALSTTNTSSNLVVKTRTGTFVGGLNDTYPNVRQFKYVPYAKVTRPPISVCADSSDCLISPPLET